MLQSFLLTLVEGVSDRVWLAVGAGLFLTIVLAVVLLLNARRHGAAPAPDNSMAWGDAAPLTEPAVAEDPALGTAAFPDPATDPLAVAPPPSQPHHCRCPACQTRFTVSGAKPIVTNCPGCGKKGYLR